MLILPPSSQALIATLPIPKDFKKLPDHIVIKMAVNMTSRYREIVPGLSNPRIWKSIRIHIAERCNALKIVELSNRLYENPEYPIRLLFQFSFMERYQRIATRFARRAGFDDIATQQVSAADPMRLRAFLELLLNKVQTVVDGIDGFDDWDQFEAEAKRYWQDIHPTLPADERQQVERDTQLFACLVFFVLHNAVAVMAFGETLSSLVQRTLAGGADADSAMCKAVRVDNCLREHPRFMARYLVACQTSDVEFLYRYNNSTPPLSNKIRYPGLYFLLSLLDGFGVLARLTNPQLLDLTDHAGLDKWENRIEDVGYLGKRLSEYRRHKFVQMSMH